MESQEQDVERGKLEDLGEEQQSLLPTASRTAHDDFDPVFRGPARAQGPGYSLPYLVAAFLAGAAACVLTQCVAFGSPGICASSPRDAGAHALAPPYVGSTKVHNWPPPSPTNDDRVHFPIDVGHAGATPTGAEPAMIATAPSYPLHTGAPQLIVPPTFHAGGKKKQSSFDLFKHWGNLSPWYSVDKGAFGVDSSPEAPATCKVTGLHFLHRHGARYPTSWASYGGPSAFAARLHETASKWTAQGELDFLNDWTYKLGEEVLTPFGRQQLYDLGISMRLKYGFLLETFNDSLPVFRTESQDRMLYSALNFASGFFGIPYEDKYLQSITIEDPGFNNTLSPYKTCTNSADVTKADRGTAFVKEWANVYLVEAQARLQLQIPGYNLTLEDVYTMQQLCAYETVAIGYSKFCGLFTQEEWLGFDYAMDIYFWYDSAFGSPIARVQGIGYVQEMVARLTHTPIATHNSSTNATLDDNPTTFPLSHALYVDATHEVVVLNIITALNLTSFAEEGPLPTDHIPEHRTFKVSQLAPFSTNIQFQLLVCEGSEEEQIRVIINDAVAPLTGIEGCPPEPNGACPVPTFVAALKKIIAKTDWNYACEGEWDVPAGHEWNTVTGDPPGTSW